MAPPDEHVEPVHADPSRAVQARGTRPPVPGDALEPPASRPSASGAGTPGEEQLAPDLARAQLLGGAAASAASGQTARVDRTRREESDEAELVDPTDPLAPAARIHPRDARDGERRRDERSGQDGKHPVEDDVEQLP